MEVCPRSQADGKFHLVADLDIICGEGEHASAALTGYIFAFGFPGAVLFGLFGALTLASRGGYLYLKNDDGEVVLDDFGRYQASEALKPIESMYVRYGAFATRQLVVCV